MPRIFNLAVAGLATLIGASTDAPVRAVAAPMVAEIADSTLRDVAVAVYSPNSPRIYYNPLLMQRFTPGLQRFFLAHEYAHIALRHTRSSALRAEAGEQDRLLQQKELEADCHAAARLGTSEPEVALEAARFFAGMGSRRFDTEHPTGAQRAARILSCLAQH
jgi:hypothetical protein